MKLPETDAYVILFSENNAKVRLGLEVTVRRGRRAVTNRTTLPRGFLVDFYSFSFRSLRSR